MKSMSVVIPLRNRKHCIEACLDGLYKQETDEFPSEVVIVDDNSTDECLSYIARWYKHKTPDWLRVFRYTKARAFNLSRCRNIGVELARYELMFTFDVDSVCHSTSLLYRLNKEWTYWNEKAIFAGVRYLKEVAAPNLTKAEKVNYDALAPRPGGLVLRTVGWGNCVFHKSLFSLVGGYDHIEYSGKGYEDLAFFLLAFRQGCYPVQYWHTSNRKNNRYMTNFKDHELPKELRVETNDEWEGGCDESARAKSYRKFRQLVEQKQIVRNNVDLQSLLDDTERII